MASIIEQAQAFVPGVQQIFKNVGFNRQQSGESSGLVPRALGGSGFVAPSFGVGQVHASEFSAPSPVGTGSTQQLTTDQNGGGAFTGGGAGTTATNQINPFENIQPSGPSQSEIDAQFNPILDVIGRAEGTLRGQLPGLISEAEANAALSRRLGKDQFTSASDILGEQKALTEQKSQRDTADQRRLLQELTLANQQRFGGASSAGLAASELQGREFQRSRFGIQQGAQQALQTIFNKKQEVQRTFDTGMQQIEVNRQAAVNDINRRFQEKLTEIDARRGQTLADKAAARMGALQDLRNQAYQINVAKAQFQADLQQQAQADNSFLAQSEQSILGSTTEATGAQTAFAGTTPSDISSVGAGTGQDTQSLQGQIQPGGVTREDLLQGSNPFGLPSGLIQPTGNLREDIVPFSQNRVVS